MRVLVGERAWSFSLMVAIVDDDGPKRKVARLVFEEVDDAVMFDPSFYLDQDGAKELMTRLWGLGVRPEKIRDVHPVIEAQSEDIGYLRSVIDRLLEKIK